MPPPDFFTRLREYYRQVALVLQGQAAAASIFPNSNDVGGSRERIYFQFLKLHAPSKCNVFFGGFIFDDDGRESKQMDIIVTTDTTPRFDFHNQDGTGKSFSPVEGTLAAVSLKSTLDKKELYDALDGIASIPHTRSLEGRKNNMLLVRHYEDWPLKVIYASKGIAPITLLDHLNSYYLKNPVPVSRRPDFIHVAGSCFIARGKDNTVRVDPVTGDGNDIAAGDYFLTMHNPDLQAISWVLQELQIRANISSQFLFSYDELVRKVLRF